MGLFNFGKENMKSEFLAALTVFMSSAYALVLIPQMMSEVGVDFDAAFFSVAISAAIGTLIIALISNKPFMAGPGLTLSIFITYSIVKAHNISWQIAIAASLLVGVVLLALSISKIRVWFVQAVPHNLRYGILGGIGLLMVFIGLIQANIVSASDATMVTLGNILSPGVLLALFGLLITGILISRKVKAAFILGMLLTTILSVAVSYNSVSFSDIRFLDFSKNLGSLAFSYDFAGLKNSDAVAIVLALFVVAFFDTIGAATALLIRGRSVDKQGNIKGLDKVMIGDSLSTIFGAVAGAPASTVYTESASAYEAGGKTGLTAVFISIFIALSVFMLPLIKMVPIEATAPVLIIVGLLMFSSITRIDLKDKAEALPALFCVAAIPFTLSITYGIGLSVIMYVAIKVFSSRAKEIHLGMWITALLFLADFLTLF